ncbi:MAG: phage tail tape measure protein, partial [Oscillospiraceae bacterium]|nr:phage tail tape measure protein [Oscillospiraceae bacterium]
KQLKAELKGTEAAFRADTSEREKSERRTKLLNEQLANENQKLRDQKAQLEALEKANKGSSKRAEELRTAIARTGAEIERIKKDLAGNNYAVAVGRDMQAAGKKIKATGESISRFGTTMTKSVTVPLAAAGAAAVKLATDFETSLAKLDTIADGSAKSMDTLKSELMSLSNASGIAASDLAEQAYQAISAGQDTANSVKFVESSAKLAKAGFTETGAALDVLTTIMNAYGLSAQDVTKVSDKLINTQNLGKVTVAQLAESMGSAIPTAASMGVNLDNLSSVYVTLTKQGVNAANATTQVNALMNQLGKSGTKASDAIKNKTGKSFQDLMKAGYSLTDVLEIVNEAAEENGVSLNDMFGNVRAGRAALALMNDGGETFTETLQSMSSAVGATDTAFEKISDTSAYRFQVALNKVKNIGIEAGGQLMKITAPALEKTADVIERATTGFANMSEEEQQAIIKTAMFAAAIGPATTALGKMTGGIGSAVEGAGRLIETFGLTGTIGVPAILGIAAAFVALNVALAEVFTAQVKYNNEFSDSFRETQKATEASKKLRDSVKESGDAYSETTEEIAANEKKAGRLADELERLSAKTERTAEEDRKMAAAVDELNDLYPGLNLKIDANTGKLNKNNDEIRDSIKNYAEQAKAIAAQERAVEINKQILSIESELVDLREQRTEAEKTMASAIAASTAEGEKYGHMTARGKAIADEATHQYDQLNAEISEQEGILATLNGQLTSTEEYLGAHKEALEANTAAAEEGARTNDILTESFEEESQAAEEAANKIREAAKLSVGAFDEVEEAQTKSIQEIIKGLQSQVEAQVNYRSNLQTLNAYIQKDTKHNWDQVVKILTEGGIDMAGELQGIVNAI